MKESERREYCYKCSNTTNQTILFTNAEISTADFLIRNESGEDNQTIYSIIGKIWTLSKCKGCDGYNLTVVTKGFGDVPPINEFRYPSKITETFLNGFLNYQ